MGSLVTILKKAKNFYGNGVKKITLKRKSVKSLNIGKVYIFDTLEWLFFLYLVFFHLCLYKSLYN